MKKRKKFYQLYWLYNIYIYTVYMANTVRYGIFGIVINRTVKSYRTEYLRNFCQISHFENGGCFPDCQKIFGIKILNGDGLFVY